MKHQSEIDISTLTILGATPIEGEPPLYKTVNEIRTFYSKRWGIQESLVSAEQIKSEHCVTPYVFVKTI